MAVHRVRGRWVAAFRLSARARVRDNPGATTAYKAAIARKADFAEAHNNLGALMLAKNDLPGAAGEFEAAVKAKPAYAQRPSTTGRRAGRHGQEAGGGRRIQGGGPPEAG